MINSSKDMSRIFSFDPETKGWKTKWLHCVSRMDEQWIPNKLLHYSLKGRISHCLTKRDDKFGLEPETGTGQ
jgi:hypothetical protein